VHDVVYDAGEGIVPQACGSALWAWGLVYTKFVISTAGYRAGRGGLEMFRDVTITAKAFGEWFESRRHTPR